MKPRPDDFALEYTWTEGTIPPPDYYEYTIRVGPAWSAAEVSFWPDYPSHDPPVWTEPFALDEQALDGLYTLMARRGAFAHDWSREEERAIGGSQEWLRCRAWGETFHIPNDVLRRAAAAEVFAAVRALVPGHVWARLFARREGYVQDTSRPLN